jgi:integrase
MFMTEHGPKLKPLTHEKYEHLLDRYLVPALGHKRLDIIDRGDVLRFHANLAAYPRLANYEVAVLSRLMTWAEDRGFRKEQTNPCLRLKKYQETKRQRYLTREELARLGSVLDDVATIGGENLFIVAAIRLLLFTGARLSEILTLKWAYVDFERGLLLLPDSKTGQKVVRLNQHAAEVLLGLPRVTGNPHVIVGRRANSPSSICRSLGGVSARWRRLRKCASTTCASFASFAAASRASLPMIGKLLGHGHTQTTARYAHLADDPLHQLNQQVGEDIAAAMAGTRSPTGV